jgi:hypothetical protein
MLCSSFFLAAQHLKVHHQKHPYDVNMPEARAMGQGRTQSMVFINDDVDNMSYSCSLSLKSGIVALKIILLRLTACSGSQGKDSFSDTNLAILNVEVW